MAPEDNDITLTLREGVLWTARPEDVTIKVDEKDNVNHPSHYEKSCSLECIDVMEAMFGSEYLIIFCLMNSFKYLWRHKNKNGKEDLDKASWYLNKATETLEHCKALSDPYDYDFEEWAEKTIKKFLCLLVKSEDKFCKK